MNNFDFLKQDSKFNDFADVAILAEDMYSLNTESCVVNCRRAMEFAVKWMYSADDGLEKPYNDSLITLMQTKDFHDIVPNDIWNRMNFIRKLGNRSTHNPNPVKKDEAKVCVENLFYFMDFIAYCYADKYEEKAFDESMLEKTPLERSDVIPDISNIDFEKLVQENKELRAELANRRKEQEKHYTSRPLDISEYETRKIYIDTMLIDAGWIEGKDWINEVELQGMPNPGGKGFADYVLYGKDGRSLAVIEAKKTCKDVAVGRQQANLYADILEKQDGRRPIIFLSNGFETRIIDNAYPERQVAGIYSKRDLEKLFNLKQSKEPLNNVHVSGYIAGRYYQKAAIEHVCEAFDDENRRKALLVMATGSGKTRTVIALIDVLLRHGWVKNILFLADRNSLVTQAKRNFVNLLPSLSVSNLCENGADYNAHCIFSTYQTMINKIDDVIDEEGRLYTIGHFDLIICDEAHRSIYNKYKDIFNYFDAPLVGLTATPKDDIDKNTYEIFELENGVPTYGYELAQAVKDGFLVSFQSIETKTGFIQEGIHYDDLSEEEKAEYEDTFEDEDGEVPDSISANAINEYVFNYDTIKKVLRILMEQGLKVDYGEKLGKTIIFAKNHDHAEKILEVFNKEYPMYPGYAEVIDNRINYSQSLIDKFTDTKTIPRIAISVDMLDTGIDIPELLNLVFFKRVLSKSKFWQMIGRGTRLCPNLVDDEDKKLFYIFDFCGNFEFFRMNKGNEAHIQMSLQAALFSLEFEIAYKLQDLQYQHEPLISFRQSLVSDMVEKVKKLDRERFDIKQHLKYVDLYKDEKNYNSLTFVDVKAIQEELAPYILPDKDDITALRFDALLFGIELSYMDGWTAKKARKDLIKKVQDLSELGTIPEVKKHEQMISDILNTDYLERADINVFEKIRNELRDLIKFIPYKGRKYDTDFRDSILASEVHEADLDSDDLKNYKAKAEYYIKMHQDNIAIAKLKANKPLTELDIENLEGVLWKQLGTKEDYKAEYGDKPLGELVREIVGLDMNAAKEAFSDFMDKNNLNSRQIYFVNQVIEYIVHNGMMKDYSVLQESPFTDQGSVVELFTDMNMWNQLKGVIEQINKNAVA